MVQSDLLESLATRMVIPLASPEFTGPTPEKLCPLITVQGQRLRALAHFAVPLPARLLKKPIDNITLQSNALVGALDVVLSGV